VTGIGDGATSDVDETVQRRTGIGNDVSGVQTGGHTTAGNIDVRRAIIKLSVPLLVDAFRRDSLFPCEYSVCGVQCDSAEIATREILKHEMIHLWLHVQGLPSGHTAEFRAKAKAIGQPRTRHGIALPAPRSGWIYSCAQCGSEFTRRRRYGRSVACSTCCKKFNGGKYDERYKLRGRKLNIK
jgi:DNA-directed RNA polymerase subunit RPC12/RpoP